MTPHVYVVETGRTAFGDLFGVSCDKDRIWFSHCSSTPLHLQFDTTTQFGDRRFELEQAYPNGFEIVYVRGGSELPEEVAHHFALAGPQTEEPS